MHLLFTSLRFMGLFKSFILNRKKSTDLQHNDDFCCAELIEIQKGQQKTVEVAFYDSCKMARHCLCDIIKPIISLAQAFGLIPLCLQHVRTEGALGGSTDCQFVFRWKSPAALTNTILIIFFFTILPFSRTEIKNRMKVVFSGTDLYAFTFQTLAMVFETSALLTFGRIYKHKFSQVGKIKFV